jgi:putative oxidoreductase
MLFETNQLIDYALLLLRIIIAIILFSSGKGHATNPKERGESMGIPKNMAFFLGVVEMIAAISIAIGIYTQLGAGLIIATMLGAIYMKLYVWKTGFYAKDGFGWHYDLLILLGTFIIFTTAGGNFVIL